MQVKGTTGKGACPFCGNAELNASLVPVEKKKSPSTPGNSTLNSTKDADDRRSSIASETDRSSGGSTKALSYTTPEQEKKLRSYSLDDTTPSNGKGPNGSNSHTASKNDREALERQIREQRLQFDERDLAEATARSARSNRSASQGSAMYFRQAVRSRYGTAPNSTGSPFGAYLSSRSVDERTTGSDSATANSPGIPDRTANSANRSNTGNIQFMSSLEGLLQTHGSTRITSIEQLEDIMLMEVRHTIVVSGTFFRAVVLHIIDTTLQPHPTILLPLLTIYVLLFIFRRFAFPCRRPLHLPQIQPTITLPLTPLPTINLPHLRLVHPPMLPLSRRFLLPAAAVFAAPRLVAPPPVPILLFVLLRPPQACKWV